MYFNSSSRDGRRKSRRQGTRDESRVAQCGTMVLMIDHLKLDFFYLVMRPQLLTQRPNPKRDNMIWSSLIQRVRENWSDQMMIYSENPFLCASDLKILRIQRSNGWNIHGIPYDAATDDSAALCFCVLLCFYVLMILCLWAISGSRASWPFSPFLCIYFVASLCFSVES